MGGDGKEGLAGAETKDAEEYTEGVTEIVAPGLHVASCDINMYRIQKKFIDLKTGASWASL